MRTSCKLVLSRQLILELLPEAQFRSLQCWIPVLEGILPNAEHNKILLDLAFDLATWHAYAKLRLHTTHTIQSLRTQTKELGRLLRKYANNLCPQYLTKPLPGEAAADYRRKVARAKKTTPTSQPPKAPNAKPSTYKHSGFNLKTYKIHALGDYADHIEQFGPTDCFSTQQVCFSAADGSRVFSPSIRENSSTVGSSDSTNVRTRCDSSAKSQSTSGWNVTTGSTSAHCGRNRAARCPDSVQPQTTPKGFCHNNTTLWRRRTEITSISMLFPTSMWVTLL